MWNSFWCLVLNPFLLAIDCVGDDYWDIELWRWKSEERVICGGQWVCWNDEIWTKALLQELHYPICSELKIVADVSKKAQEVSDFVDILRILKNY